MESTGGEVSHRVKRVAVRGSGGVVSRLMPSRAPARARDMENGTVTVQEDQQIGSSVWTVPNLISFLRLALTPVFAVLIVSHHDLWALFVLAFSGFTDWLDGTLARRLHQVSRLGQMLDPAADRLFIFVTLVSLAWREVVPLWLVVVIVARDIMLGALIPVLARHGYGPLEVSMVGKAGTFALLYAFPLLLLAGAPGTLGTAAHIVGWAFTWWGVGLYWLAGLQYVMQARTLLSADGAPPDRVDKAPRAA